MTFERLSAAQFIIKLHESSSCGVAFIPLFQELVLTVIEDGDKTSYYFGPDPRTTPKEEYKAFQISVDAISAQKVGN